MFVPNSVSLTCPGLQIFDKNPDGCISDFHISGQSLIKRNCHNSRTSADLDMKLRPVTKINKRNKSTSKKFVDDVMSENSDVTDIFPIYGQFGAIGNRILDA